MEAKEDKVDKTLICQECQQEFVFSTGEQEYFEKRGFSEPKRCASCRRKRRQYFGNRR